MVKLRHVLVGVGIGFLLSQSVVAVLANHHEKPAYLVVSGNYIDRNAMEPYYQAARPLAADVGIEVLARSERIDAAQVLEGEWPHDGFVIVERFPSMQILKDFWHSDAYQAAKPLRDPAVTMNFIIAVEGQ